jgi:hypothetical protein
VEVVDDREDDVGRRVDLRASLNAEFRRPLRGECEQGDDEEHYDADTDEKWHTNLRSDQEVLVPF